MGSDKTKALIAFAKLVIALAAGYAMVTIWSEARAGIDPDYVVFGSSVPLIPYAAGLVVTVMVFFLLSRLSKGSGD